MSINKIICTLLFAAITLMACSKEPVTPEPPGPPEPPGNTDVNPISKNHRVIYEVNVRNFSAGGNLAGVQNDLPRLKDLGVDILWLMPIHPIGEQNREGTFGSPYAVKDYKAVNPDYGTLADLKALVKAAHDMNMEIWLDWVANHTAWDHSWAKDHPLYYAEKDGIRPYSPQGWNDVIQLDFNNSEMREAMIDAMKYWVAEADIDGYRCDAATFVPLDFWQQARSEVDKVKKITWLEEGDAAAYIPAFDYDYAWSFNTRLNEFGKSKDVTALKQACTGLFSNKVYADKGRMVYLTNHDLNSHESTEFTRYGNNLLPLMVLYFTIYDMPLIYNGQEIGYNKQMSLFNSDVINWTNVNQPVNTLLKKLTRLKRTTPALESGVGRGTLYTYTTDQENIYAYVRKKGNSETVVLLNFADQPVTFKFIGNRPEGSFTNYFEGGKIEFGTNSSLSLPANGYAVYVK